MKKSNIKKLVENQPSIPFQDYEKVYQTFLGQGSQPSAAIVLLGRLTEEPNDETGLIVSTMAEGSPIAINETIKRSLKNSEEFRNLLLGAIAEAVTESKAVAETLAAAMYEARIRDAAQNCGCADCRAAREGKPEKNESRVHPIVQLFRDMQEEFSKRPTRNPTKN